MNRIRARSALLPVIALFVAAAGMLSAGEDKGPQSSLIFPHPLHVVEQGIECVTCHGGIETSARAEDRNLPSMETCSNCHDTDDDKLCGECHRDPENPTDVETAEPTVSNNHQRHLAAKIVCSVCHGMPSVEPTIPSKPTCMRCHNGVRAASDCALCHERKQTLANLHPSGWKHQHAEQAVLDPDWCAACHRQEQFCIDCHRGDNLTGNIHDLNYRLTHGLDAQGKESDCSRCHDRRAFCSECHDSENRMPLAHSTIAWRTEHGAAARRDIENCASCHEADDPTCARSGCHLDSDGLRGTDQRFHAPDLGRFDNHGPWHNDDGYSCFTCHTSTHQPGAGFCGYCHGDGD